MSGFTEEWLAEHQARMAALKSAPSPEPSLAASPESPKGSHPRSKCVLTDDELIALYRECGNSIWRTGERAGISGSRVQQRLRPLLGPGLEGLRLWTPEDNLRLQQDYVVFASTGKLSILAKDMGRTTAFIARKAKALGLTNKIDGKPWARGGALKGQAADFADVCQSLPDAELATRFSVHPATIIEWRKRLDLMKDRTKVWETNPHPRGYTGHTHSPEVREVLSEKSRIQWADPKSIVNSKAHRQKLSDRMSALQASGAVRAAYSRGSMGRRADLGGLFVRSSWEANVARYLNFLKDRGEIFGWAYEPDTFWFEAIKRGVRSYKPDFKVWKREGADAYYIEVKGWMDAKSKTKLKRMKKYHPTVRVDVLDAKQYRALAQTVGHLLPNWERAAIDGGRRDTLL